jgi:hypothetical protein
MIPATTEGISTRFVITLAGEKKFAATKSVEFPILSRNRRYPKNPPITVTKVRTHFTLACNLGQKIIKFAMAPTKTYKAESLRAPKTRVRLIPRPINKATVLATCRGLPIVENSAKRNIQEKRTPVIAQELGLIEGMI